MFVMDSVHCLAWPGVIILPQEFTLSSFSSYNDHVGPVASLHLREDGFN